MKTLLAVVCAVALHALAGCAPGDADTDAVALAVPQALVDCAAPPPDLSARMWVSGSSTPCELTVDLGDGTTLGNCRTAPGRVRTLTVDWYAPLDGGLELVLAQARTEVDLTQAEEANVPVTLGDDDVKTSGCRDMREDQVEGSPTIELDGVDVPVCDVDASCADPADPACSNLGELCAGADPLDPTVEP